MVILPLPVYMVLKDPGCLLWHIRLFDDDLIGYSPAAPLPLWIAVTTLFQPGQRKTYETGRTFPGPDGPGPGGLL